MQALTTGEPRLRALYGLYRVRRSLQRWLNQYELTSECQFEMFDSYLSERIAYLLDNIFLVPETSINKDLRLVNLPVDQLRLMAGFGFGQLHDPDPVMQEILISLQVRLACYRRQNFIFRMLAEVQHFQEVHGRQPYVVFDTVTVEPAQYELFTRDPAKELELYRKRVQYAVNGSVRFYQCPEIGSQGRLHYHIFWILENLPSWCYAKRTDDDDQQIPGWSMSQRWHLGAQHRVLAVRTNRHDRFAEAGYAWPAERNESSLEATVLYCAKYTTQQMELPGLRRSSSRGLGLDWLRNTLRTKSDSWLQKTQGLRPPILRYHHLMVPTILLRTMAFREIVSRTPFSMKLTAVKEYTPRPSIVGHCAAVIHGRRMNSPTSSGHSKAAGITNMGTCRTWSSQLHALAEVSQAIRRVDNRQLVAENRVDDLCRSVITTAKEHLEHGPRSYSPHGHSAGHPRPH